jgi:hypothetical protein
MHAILKLVKFTTFVIFGIYSLSFLTISVPHLSPSTKTLQLLDAPNHDVCLYYTLFCILTHFSAKFTCQSYIKCKSRHETLQLQRFSRLVL